MEYFTEFDEFAFIGKHTFDLSSWVDVAFSSHEFKVLQSIEAIPDKLVDFFWILTIRKNIK